MSSGTHDRGAAGAEDEPVDAVAPGPGQGAPGAGEAEAPDDSGGGQGDGNPAGEGALGTQGLLEPPPPEPEWRPDPKLIAAERVIVELRRILAVLVVVAGGSVDVSEAALEAHRRRSLTVVPTPEGYRLVVTPAEPPAPEPAGPREPRRVGESAAMHKIAARAKAITDRLGEAVPPVTGTSES